MDRAILVSVFYLGGACATSYRSTASDPIGSPDGFYYPTLAPPSPCVLEWFGRNTNNCSVDVTCTSYAAVRHLERSFVHHTSSWKCYEEKLMLRTKESEVNNTVKHINLILIGRYDVELTTNDNDWLQRIKQIKLKDNPVNVPKDLFKLRAIENIEINNYNIGYLNFTRFSELKELINLNISGNSINRIGSKLNNETSLTNKLKTLDLSYNYITNVRKLWKLGRFSNLTFLDLSHNAIRSIEMFAFQGLTLLRSLYLAHNHILHIGSSLSKLINIEEITLDHNDIVAIDRNNFAGLGKIEKLNLSSNDIQFIESDAFADLTNLMELDLSFNELKAIEKQHLRYSNKLCTLLLRNNNIETLEPGVFEGKNITKFNIQNNAINGLLDNSFEAINVQYLDLNDMKIGRIGAKTFSSAVHALNLSHNLIHWISPSAFSEVKHLKSLDLSYNQLPFMNFSLSFSKALSSLYLQHNHIENIRQFTLKNVPSLQNLDLSYNRIFFIDNKSFIDLKRLELLFLNNNIALRNFKNGTFDGLESLLYLSFYDTSISELQDELFSDLKQLETLNASRCQIEKIQYNAFKNLDSLTMMDFSFNLLMEFSVNNKDITELEILFLTSNKIKSISDVTFQGLHRLILLKLSNNNIVRISDNAFNHLRQLIILYLDSNADLEINTKSFDNLALRKLVLENITKGFNFKHTLNSRVSFLDLSFCQIKNVENLLIYNVVVEELVLKFNEITQLDKHSFFNLSSLESLDISFNAVSYIQPGTFLQLGNLKTLNLHDNDISKLDIGAFEGLEKLQILNLSNNEISSFKYMNVRKLHSLKFVSLDNNKIESIMFTAFVDTRILKISIGGNNIPCSDITNYKVLYTIRKIVLTADVLDFHSENVDGIQCNHNPKPDGTIMSPQTNATYVLAGAIEKLQEILRNKTILFSFDGNKSKVVNNNDTSEKPINNISIKKMVNDLYSVSYRLENQHSDVGSVVYITVVCLVVIVVMYLTIFIPKVKRILRYRLRSQSSIPLLNIE